MAAVCEFYSMTPAQYWAVTLDEETALVAHIREVNKAREAANKKQQRRRR